MPVDQWNLEQFYPHPGHETLINDIDRAGALLDQIEQALDTGPLDFSETYRTLHKARILANNISYYLFCWTAIDHEHKSLDVTQNLSHELSAKQTRITEMIDKRFRQVSKNNQDAVLSVLAGDLKKELEFRLERQAFPSEDYSCAFAMLESDGLKAFQSIRNGIARKFTAKIDFPSGARVVNASAIDECFNHTSAIVRKQFYRCWDDYYTNHQETLAKCLSAIIGWRIKEKTTRYQDSRLDLLHDAFYLQKTTQDTVETLRKHLSDFSPKVHEALGAMAQACGKGQLEPEDIWAPMIIPAPKMGHPMEWNLSQALEFIDESMSKVDPEFSNFLIYMQKNSLIEASQSTKKHPGAFCIHLPQNRVPLVYCTFTGTIASVSTLAHELGHAYHYWICRDLSEGDPKYPMTLAETASTFTEIIVCNHLIERFPDQELAIRWHQSANFLSFAVNSMLRFDLEHWMNQTRISEPLTADRLNQKTKDLWKLSYGSNITEGDSRYWAKISLFFFSHIEFYNYPYAVGYFIALALVQRQIKNSESFADFYRDFLHATPFEKVESLVLKNLGYSSISGFIDEGLKTQEDIFDRLHKVCDKLEFH